ncbi:WYL domain-containing protein [Chlorogloeopsis sp. ULAP01]|uniref:helix-turn-helix transcriptional regulator n=1 Tax=Chlorogloeopsis sp. ULAP01 TaxID=3056483 RepID=UPI0025AB5115|nr:WYL domain-containing protein [Chlorogloeopsis sp. ULAP01]MDM9385021.1 WYL domain-containing protein [Chlorogloeopsis sp. ULAP01]
MSKKPTSHPYGDVKAFERLMLLIATLLKHPGVGSPEFMESSDREHHNSLKQVQLCLQNLAADYGVELPKGYPSIPTLRKDLETLRRYGILEDRMYRWGYYLGTGAMSQEELKVAFNALASQAKYQGDGLLRRIYQTLSKRLRGLDLELQGEFFYPVRQHLNRAIVYTDPEEMAALGQNRDTLFHQLAVLEKAICQGQTIEISRGSDPYGHSRIGPQRVVPLQLIYQDIAWYLLYEHHENGHLAIGRLNRFKNYCQVLNESGRGLEAQRNSLAKAYQLLENGWGLYLGEPPEQQLELQGKLELITVKVRFFPPVANFIQEGELRHLKQKIVLGAKNPTTGKPSYIDYVVSLPPRSLDEFSIWVCRYMDKARVIAPPQLVEKHHQAAKALLAQYNSIEIK